MVEHSKRRKFHDKDKYYRLAKEQGLRSRAAFKLSQINRKFQLLEKCEHAVLDLCAAPGGWTQIAARTCAGSVNIVAVDILPIRPIVAKQSNNSITTLIGDITTDKCKSDIKRALQGEAVDLVLHDGAPNVGAEYGKDAYEQNELCLHALKCATSHLKVGGHFVTKIYRSRDYASYQWILQQCFASVHAIKPAASRSQSAEIFLVAKGYKGGKLDPRFLDPKHVFGNVEGETTGGSGVPTGMTILDKSWDKPRRKRSGYDMDHLDATMRHVESVDKFVNSNLKQAIQILSTSTGLTFSCQECQQEEADDDDNESQSCACRFLLHHPLTTTEIKECATDLQVLNKSDFKCLLSWRTKMQEGLQAKREEAKDNEKDSFHPVASGDESIDSEKEEEEIQAEIEEMRQRRLREKKRHKKKERAAAAKRRRQAALGMDLNAIDVPEHDKVFSLASITSKGDLEAAAEVNLDRVTDEQLFGHSDDDVIVGEENVGDELQDEESTRLKRREKELDDAYDLYLANTKDGAARSGTKMAKRSKKLQRLKVAEEAAEDQEMALSSPAGIGSDTKAYAEMLHGPRDSDDEDELSSDDEDDGYYADPMTPDEHQAKVSYRKSNDNKNPLIHRFPEESAPAKTARWFSNPLFASIGQAAESAVSGNDMEGIDDDSSDYDDDSTGVASASFSSNTEDKLRQDDIKKDKSKRKAAGMSADEVLAMIPKTDKQIRHERRLKQMARQERKKARRLGDMEEKEFELAPSDKKHGEVTDDKLDHLSESQKRKVEEARALIKAGMGTTLAECSGNSTGIEVIPESARPLPVMDDRKYDSEHEDYDSDDYAQTLALGTMMLRRSKEKALVDASYNRYAWNDPSGLPDWFTDDENKHYRPQLPIPPALLAKMKEKMMALSTKPIAKVAEARARKDKRAKAKLAAAKKKAAAVANSSDMSEVMKLKAISKALRGHESKSKPGKTYVVAKKGRGMGIKGAKGVKVVDKRLKADKRATERIEKKRRKGKQNGLVGSKKRRHHK